MFSTEFRMRCLLQIEASIHIPLKGFFIRNASSIRMHYVIGQKKYYLILASRVEVAIFLKNHHIIQSYDINSDGSVHMFTHQIGLTTGYNGVPIQYIIKVPFKWEEMSFSAAQVQTFAAKAEWARIKAMVDSESFAQKTADYLHETFKAA